jgi:predicted ATP-binding protein involved in virulence
MKLLHIEIKNLFNIFNHFIDLKKERITILTAPNGYGKTITLKTINSLFNKKFSFFVNLSFSEIVFKFEENYTIQINKSISDELSNIEFTLYQNNKKLESFKYPPKNYIKELRRHFPTRAIEDFIPDFIHRIGSNEWLNELDNEILSLDEVLNQFGEYLPDNILKRIDTKIPEEFLNFIDNFNVYLIQEQRLVLRQPVSEARYRREVVITDTIEKYSKELSNLIKQKIGEYAQITQSLDSSFPKRLFKHESGNINIEELKNRLKDLEAKRKKLSKYGFLKSEETTFFDYDNIEENDTKVLSLYIKDNEEKLSVFDSLINKIELFTNILNNRRFNFKSIEIDKDKGFIFVSKDKSTLKLTELSSGEQHEVVLLFELLFKAEENSLVLIDEPEISLHVVWQKEFLNDIQEIIELQKIDIIIATHSPQIINNKWELTVDLGESVNE